MLLQLLHLEYNCRPDHFLQAYHEKCGLVMCNNIDSVSLSSLVWADGCSMLSKLAYDFWQRTLFQTCGIYLQSLLKVTSVTV